MELELEEQYYNREENTITLYFTAPSSILDNFFAKGSYPDAISAELSVSIGDHPYLSEPVVCISPTRNTMGGTEDYDWSEISLPDNELDEILNLAGVDRYSLLYPLPEGAKVTRSRKEEAMYALIEYTGHADFPRPANDKYKGSSDKEWYLAEARKYGTVRIIKHSGHWIATAYGTVNSIRDYYGVDVNTGKLINNELAKTLYHKSKA